MRFVVPPTVNGTLGQAKGKMLNRAVAPPPATNPQVYAQNYSCPVPNIQIFRMPPWHPRPC